MKRIISMMFFVLITVGIAGAFILGETMTSEEFKLKNIQEEDICSYKYFGETTETIDFYFECVTVYRVGGDDYEVKLVEQVTKISYDKQKAKDCFALHTKGWCWNNKVKPEVLNEVREFIKIIREDMELRQQRATPRNAQLNSIIGFTMEEING